MASANNTLIGAIRAEATLEGGKFVSGAKKIQQSAKQTETQLKKSFGVMGSAVKGFGLSLASGLSIGLLSNAIKKALDYAGSLGEIAQQLGVTTKDLQVFRFAAGQVGVSQEELETGLSKLTITLGKVAAGAKAPIAALNAIGVSVDEIKGKDTGEAFRIIADGLQKVTDRSQRAAIEVALFGRSGAKLDTLLSGGSSALNELADAAERLGIVLSDEQIQKADETADKLDAIKTVLSAQIAGVVADNADAILTLANAFVMVASAAGKAIGAVAGFVNFLRQNPISALNPAAALGAYIGGQITKPGTKGSATAIIPQARPAGRPAGANIGQFLAGGGGGRSKRSVRAPRDTSLRDAFQFEQEQRRAEIDILRAKQDLAHDYVERTSLATRMLDLEKEGFEAELRFRVADGDLKASQAEALKLKFEEADRLRRMAVLEDEELQRQRDFNMLDEKDFDIKMDKLEREANLAETASERRAVELRILDLAYEEERRRLNRIIQESKDWAEIEAARRDLLALSENQQLDREGVIQGTRGPMEDWQASLPTSAAKMQEAFEELQVQGFEGLIDAAVALTEGFDSAKDALLNTLKQFLQGLLRAQLQSALGSVLKGVKLPGFATGGSFTIGGRTGIDNNIMSINGLPVARVSYGERINVSNDNGRNTYGNRGDTIVNVNGVRDFDSFRRNERQVGRAARRTLGLNQ